jgi:prepilin peptidase CpaA
MTWAAWAAVGVAAIGCATDLRSRRIPNWLTFGAALAGVVTHTAIGGWAGLAQAAGGWCVGLLLFLPFFLLRGMGGGDVKLLAALGAWLGPGSTLWLAAWSAICGGAFAIVVATARGYTGQALTNVWGILMFWRVMGVQPHPGVTLESAKGPRLPYSLPIAAGLGLTLWLG